MKILCRTGQDSDSNSVLRINRDALPGVSKFDDVYFHQLRTQCEHYRVIEVDGSVAGYLFAMTSNANYDGEEYRWFREHCREPFFYIDQVAVAPAYRGRGLGVKLYEDLEEAARHTGLHLLTCEVNYEPFNAASQAFHERLGFNEVGQLSVRELTVSLLQRRFD